MGEIGLRERQLPRVYSSETMRDLGYSRAISMPGSHSKVRSFGSVPPLEGRPDPPPPAPPMPPMEPMRQRVEVAMDEEEEEEEEEVEEEDPAFSTTSLLAP